MLFAELRAYKSIRADTGQERYDVLCDLLEICSEDSGRLQERAASLVELAQVLCYHNYAQQINWWVPRACRVPVSCVPVKPFGSFGGISVGLKGLEY